MDGEDMEKQLKENFKSNFNRHFNQYRWVLLIGIIVAICLMVIMSNLGYFSMIGYMLTSDTKGVLESTESYIVLKQDQNQITFKKGMQYLLRQRNDTKEVNRFFEENFNNFLPEWQKEILIAYGKKEMTIPMSRPVIETIVHSLNDENIKGYVELLNVEDLERGLALVYGRNPEVTPEFVDTLYQVLLMYPKKLAFNQLEFNLYDVLKYDGENAGEKIQFIIRKIEPKVAQENLFKHLRKEPLSVDVLNEWIEFFNSIGIITANEYINFNQYYGNICLLRNQQSDLDKEEKTLREKITVIESMIKEENETILLKEQEKEPIVKEIEGLDTILESLNDYSTIEFFIERPSGTGNNEYIASIPRNGIFRIRPGDMKYIIKLTRTTLYDAGLYELNIYASGTKMSMDGREYSYFVEVSKSQYNEIEQKESQRLAKVRQLDAIETEISVLQKEVDTIKDIYQYNELKRDVDNMNTRRLEYHNKIEEEVTQIRKLFELNQLTS